MKRFKQFVLNNRKGWGMGIAIYQLLGSLVMLWLVYANVHDLSIGTLLFVIPIVGICLTGLVAAIVYFFKGDVLRFYTLSKLNLCVQLLQLSVQGFAFSFYYGPYLAVGFDGDPSLVIRFESLTASFSFRIGETAEQYVVFNLVPLMLVLALRWMERNPVKSPEFENSFLEEQSQ